MTGCILALDLGAWTGWAYATAAAVAGWPLPVPGARGPVDGVYYGARRWRAPVHVPFRAWLDKMAADVQPAWVVFEAPLPIQAQKSHAAGRDALQLAGAVESVCAERGIRCAQEHAGTIKKHFAGTGRAKKVDIMHACRARGWTPERHDTADALALLDRAVWMIHGRHQGRAA